MTRSTGPAALAVLLAAAGVQVQADVYHLRDGDRITGRTLSATPTGFRIQTPYGRLVIPRKRVEKIVRDDGTEDVVNPRPAEAPPTKPPLRLTLIVTGHAFWYAWDPPRGIAVDPTLRLEVSLDEEPVAEYLDRKPDPEDIPRARLVNAFAFGAEEVSLASLGPARALPPESRPGRTVLRIELPEDGPGERRLRLAYQINTGAASEPAWRDVTAATLDLVLRRDGATLVQVRQDRGRMEFSGLLKRRMRNTETFRIEIVPDSTAAAARQPPA